LGVKSIVTDQGGTGDTVESGDLGPEGEPRETASDAAPGGEQEGVAAATSGDADATHVAAQEEAEVDAKRKKKKDKKKDSGLGSSRGIETMFRTSYRVHQDLVGLADAKANIMISVNGFIIAITMPFAPQIARQVGWLLPLATGVLLVGCVTALVYAVLAARPRVSNIPITLEDIAQNDANILFFGNFVNLSEAEFVEGMRDLMLTQDHLYVNMVRDLYGLGQVLKTKFQLLRISYTVFMFALVLGVGLFVLGFLDASLAGDLPEPLGALPLSPS
jgi:hypothetical protein